MLVCASCDASVEARVDAKVLSSASFSGFGGIGGAGAGVVLGRERSNGDSVSRRDGAGACRFGGA